MTGTPTKTGAEVTASCSAVAKECVFSLNVWKEVPLPVALFNPSNRLPAESGIPAYTNEIARRDLLNTGGSP